MMNVILSWCCCSNCNYSLFFCSVLKI